MFKPNIFLPLNINRTKQDNRLITASFKNNSINLLDWLGIDLTNGSSSLVLAQDGTWVNNGALSWSLTGNSGTTAGTNFIGTIDSKDLVFKTNNTEKLRIESGGNVGINVTNPDSKLDGVGTFLWNEATSGDNSSFQIGKLLLGAVPFDGLYTNKINNKVAYIGYFNPGSDPYLGVSVFNAAVNRANGLIVNENHFTLAEYDVATDSKQYGFSGYGVEQHADMFCYDLATDTDINSFSCFETNIFMRFYQDYSLPGQTSTILSMNSTGVHAGLGVNAEGNPSTDVWQITTNGNFVLPNIRTFANDVAAAAASPAVPINGLYRETTTGYVKARIS